MNNENKTAGHREIIPVPANACTIKKESQTEKYSAVVFYPKKVNFCSCRFRLNYYSVAFRQVLAPFPTLAGRLPEVHRA